MACLGPQVLSSQYLVGSFCWHFRKIRLHREAGGGIPESERLSGGTGLQSVPLHPVHPARLGPPLHSGAVSTLVAFLGWLETTLSSGPCSLYLEVAQALFYLHSHFTGEPPCSPKEASAPWKIRFLSWGCRASSSLPLVRLSTLIRTLNLLRWPGHWYCCSLKCVICTKATIHRDHEVNVALKETAFQIWIIRTLPTCRVLFSSTHLIPIAIPGCRWLCPVLLMGRCRHKGVKSTLTQPGLAHLSRKEASPR